MGEGKRVSWVELYLDLVFVLAVGQIAHLIVAEPEMKSVWIAFGLIFTLWWTWVGFAVLYNRHGADRPTQRLLFFAGSVPAGVAAVAIEPAAAGDSAVFAGSLAVARLVLAAATSPARARPTSCASGLRAPAWPRRRCSRCRSSFPEPFRYVLWAIADRGGVPGDPDRGPRGRAPAAAKPRPQGARAHGPVPGRSTPTTSPSASGCS